MKLMTQKIVLMGALIITLGADAYADTVCLATCAIGNSRILDDHAVMSVGKTAADAVTKLYQNCETIKKKNGCANSIIFTSAGLASSWNHTRETSFDIRKACMDSNSN